MVDQRQVVITSTHLPIPRLPEFKKIRAGKLRGRSIRNATVPDHSEFPVLSDSHAGRSNSPTGCSPDYLYPMRIPMAPETILMGDTYDAVLTSHVA